MIIALINGKERLLCEDFNDPKLPLLLEQGYVIDPSESQSQNKDFWFKFGKIKKQLEREKEEIKRLEENANDI